jgi:hypothetical protein
LRCNIQYSTPEEKYCVKNAPPVIVKNAYLNRDNGCLIFNQMGCKYPDRILTEGERSHKTTLIKHDNSIVSLDNIAIDRYIETGFTSSSYMQLSYTI